MNIKNILEAKLLESVRSRVAMDFTGPVSRIIEDPVEARLVALAEGYSWKRRWRPISRTSCKGSLEAGIHTTQPWFHSGMTREQAQLIIGRQNIDGCFLVRESQSTAGAFVLTYKCNHKVLHAQITPTTDSLKKEKVYTLDNGATKFYDILQLVEFYQLNTGCLQTRLTHYVVQESPASSSNPSP